ncbi:MAG: amidophosphoribosyltransferase [Endomicrobiales bacterium]
MSGIFGAVTEGDCAELVLYGTDYHSHLGTEFGGIAVLGKGFSRQIHNISHSQFKSKFSDDVKLMKGNRGIGVISAFDEQPMYLKSRLGEFCIVTNGFVYNTETLARELFKKGGSFTEVSKDTVNLSELAAKMISRGKTIADGIDRFLGAIDGSCSLLVLHRDGIYAARDRHGCTPLVVGKRGREHAVTSETCAFPNLGFEPVRELQPGEIAVINEKGVKSLRKGTRANQICSFLWIYTGFPASSYEGRNAEVVREHCGRFLARNDRGLKADLVAGVPDSGIAHAQGYAMESGIPLRRPLVKYTPGYGRSYTPPNQKTRDLIATMKLIPVREIIDGNRIVLCEDSIVRGTQLKNYTVKKLWDCGAKEIHVRPACPPLMFPCRFSFSTRSIDELATRKAIRALEGRDIRDVSAYVDHTSAKYRKMIDWIRRDLEITSLQFQTMEDMIKAIGLPQSQLCLHCWLGK